LNEPSRRALGVGLAYAVGVSVALSFMWYVSVSVLSIPRQPVELVFVATCGLLASMAALLVRLAWVTANITEPLALRNTAKRIFAPSSVRLLIVGWLAIGMGVRAGVMALPVRVVCVVVGVGIIVYGHIRCNRQLRQSGGVPRCAG